MDNFNILAEDIMSDILTRLPAESVLSCKLVSKTWRNIIQHPSFAKIHTNRLTNHPTGAYPTNSCKLSFLALSGNDLFSYFEYVEDHETPISKIRRVNLRPPFKCHEFIGSINGLICLHLWQTGFCICNPLTKEYVILPEPTRNTDTYYHTSFGFGYLVSTNEYKVVVMHNRLEKEPNFIDVMVYTLGSGNGWRNIQKFDDRNNDPMIHIGIFMNGSLHWYSTNRILVFDLADENFREHLLSPFSLTLNCYKFGVLGDSLYCDLRKFGDQTSSDIWLYKKKNDKCDVKEQDDDNQSLGWSKEYTLAKDSKPLALTKSGSVLSYHYYDPCYLYIYDPHTSTSKELVDFKEVFGTVLPHKNTFVSLKELGEPGTKFMQSLDGVRRNKKRHG